MDRRLLAPLVLITTLTFAGSPFLTDGFRGFTPSQFPVVADRWPVQPIGWAFSIWGAIYLWLIAGAAYGLVRAWRDEGWQEMRPALILSLAVGSFWITVANLQPVLATVMLIFMAATAIAAFLRAPRGRGGAGLWGAGPVGLYAGWVTAACGVAIAITLGGQGVLTGQQAAYLSLTGVTLTALVVVWRRPDVPSYAFGAGWALFGVIVSNARAGDWPVLALALVGLLLVAATLLLRRRKLQ
ncbi:hypothetical protein H9N28_03700 [Rhodobacter capsulatus]|uniref:Tryptophan-rich sensory protein n=1 Tax=Rhodobacter capsulatus TaxID=1061 RepID=A0A0Q1A1U8_RHOCA|nr:hypothetical protein [Rhodobacter capsulatus]KQB15237.1 hypothetical protein AP073_14290 [Rhodobacter capsulatus]KQB16046.1 hypothetical protein AP071_12790 [Rhodobacter capsulatus]PZX25648.1 hypothetical protein LY44_01431 [Rhodobacter capsulatus]QNR63954.1 hypothetical protein H9N28_03700 [Rhodobacter capsulatus]WER10081.1 hypothetical protein PUH89_03570 [Rhodobacter capsulatus]